MANFIFARNPKMNNWVRWGICFCSGGAFLANTHYSVLYLQGIAEQPNGVMLATHILTSVTVTVICLCVMGCLTNPAFWGFMTEELQDVFKKLKGIGAIMGMIAQLIILSALVTAVFFLYRWDLTTTQFGFGLMAYPMLSSATVPVWALVFAPDIGAIAWNISSEVDKRTRTLRGGSKKPTQGSANSQVSQGNPLKWLL